MRKVDYEYTIKKSLRSDKGWYVIRGSHLSPFCSFYKYNELIIIQRMCRY